MKRDRALRAMPRMAFSMLFYFVGFLSADFALAANQVSFVAGSPTLLDGALLPETPTTLDSIFFREALLYTFPNSCFARAANGDARVAIDALQKTILVSFDESTADPSPHCTDVNLPASIMQLELDPLAAGRWTLELDEMLTIFPRPLRARTVVFDVVPVGAVESVGGRAYFIALPIGIVLAGVVLEILWQTRAR